MRGQIRSYAIYKYETIHESYFKKGRQKIFLLSFIPILAIIVTVSAFVVVLDI